MKSANFSSHSDDRGTLIAFDKLDSFNVKRFYVVECTEGMRRGKHYHKIGKQLICLIEGELLAFVSKNEKKDFFVMKPGDTFYQETFCKFEFESKTKSSKLLVLCDTEHDQSDYYNDQVVTT